MEIGFFREIGEETLQFLRRAGVTLAVASKVAQMHTALTQLYEETQQQAEELERAEEHTSELQSLMRIAYAVFCLIKTVNYKHHHSRDDKQRGQYDKTH